MRRPLALAPLLRLGLLASPVALVACGERAAEPAWGAAPPPPNVLLVSIDTLRADRLGFHGYERPTSPELDAFAETAVVFERAFASASWTLPGLASALTSTWPSTHRCWSYGSRLDDSFTTLAEILTPAGFDSACVTSHLFVTSRHGLQQGFVHFDDTWAHPPVEPNEAVTSRQISDAGIRFLEHKAAAGDGTPWLLWLHYFDPHDAYLLHEGLTERFLAGDGPPSESERYDGEIAWTDQQVGRVLAALEALGLADETVVVLFSDHGEEFGDHGGLRHGHTLYDELLRVPFVIRAPGVAPRRIDGVVRTVDLLPTVLELVGLPSPAGIEGHSLVPAMRGEELRQLPAFAEIRLDPAAAMEAIVLGRWKLVRHLDEGETRELYDLEADPGETREVSAEHPEVTERLTRLLDGLRREAQEKAERYEVSPEAGLPPVVAEQLRGLGYLE